MQSAITFTLSVGVLAAGASWFGAYLLIANDKLARPRRVLLDTSSNYDAWELAPQSS
jgi:hypothetical protein